MIKGVYCRPKTPPNAGGCIVSRREAVFNDGFYTVRGQPSDQFLTRAAYLLIAKNTLVSTLVRVRRTPEVKPAGITAEGRAIRGPIARHYTASYLDVNRHNHMIIFSPGETPIQPSLPDRRGRVARPISLTCMRSMWRSTSIFCIRNLILRIAASENSVKR